MIRYLGHVISRYRKDNKRNASIYLRFIMSSEESRGRPRLNLKPRNEAAAAKAAEDRAKASKSVRSPSTDHEDGTSDERQ